MEVVDSGPFIRPVKEDHGGSSGVGGSRLL